MDKAELHKWKFERAERAKTAADKSLDSIVFILSTGTFALTINLLSFFNGPIQNPYLLIFAWLALLVSITSHAYGYWESVRQNQYFIDCLGDPKRGYDEPSAEDPKNSGFRQRIARANKIAYFALALGVGALTLFAITNLLEKNSQENMLFKSFVDSHRPGSWRR